MFSGGAMNLAWGDLDLPRGSGLAGEGDLAGEIDLVGWSGLAGERHISAKKCMSDEEEGSQWWTPGIGSLLGEHLTCALASAKRNGGFFLSR